MAALAGRSDIDFSRVNFLIVEDKPMAREMVHASLVGRAKSIRQASTVEKAIAVLNEVTDIDCIISDWEVHPIGGLELLRMIRCRTLPQVSPRTSFVIFTARADADAVRCAIELDVNGFVAAPLSLDKLARTIGNALNRTWLLQEVAHYASVPGIAPPVPLEEIVATGSKGVILNGAQGLPFSHVATSRHHARTRMCGLKDLQPGSVLARDIRDSHGQLLLRNGTALEPAIIDRLRKAAGDGADRYQVCIRT